MKPLLNRDWSVTLKYCRGVPNQKNCQRLPNRGILPGEGGGGARGNSVKPLWNRDRSVTLKYCRGVPNQKNCQRLPNRGILPGSVETKLLPVSITIKSTNKECHH